ncbi:hypothetical protein V391_02749, partial [Staphylococcus aureus T35615]
MEQIKLKTFTAETLELLEKNINAFLSSEEATNLKLVNITIKEIEERTFPNNEEEFNAILTLSVNVLSSISLIVIFTNFKFVASS